MNTSDKVAVCSRSFSRNPILREELLARYQQVTFNEEGIQFAGDSLIAFLQNHDKAIIALEPIDEATLLYLPKLKVISKYGVGLDSIDMDAIQRLGIRFSWTGGVNSRSVSELVLCFAIALLRHVPRVTSEVLAGKWQQRTGNLLSGRTVGIIGCSYVGKDLVRLLQPFGCQILVYDIKIDGEFCAQYGVTAMTLDELLTRSDIVSLHVALNESTRLMLSAERLKMMKSTAILINTARGGLVDEFALKNRLQLGQLAAAGFDVFMNEPPEDQELLALSNFYATPHIGGSTEEAIISMGRAAINGLD